MVPATTPILNNIKNTWIIRFIAAIPLINGGTDKGKVRDKEQHRRQRVTSDVNCEKLDYGDVPDMTSPPLDDKLS